MYIRCSYQQPEKGFFCFFIPHQSVFFLSKEDERALEVKSRHYVSTLIVMCICEVRIQSRELKVWILKISLNFTSDSSRIQRTLFQLAQCKADSTCSAQNVTYMKSLTLSKSLSLLNGKGRKNGLSRNYCSVYSLRQGVLRFSWCVSTGPNLNACNPINVNAHKDRDRASERDIFELALVHF